MKTNTRQVMNEQKKGAGLSCPYVSLIKTQMGETTNQNKL